MANGKSKRANAKPTPVSAHPVFPAIVALWFAALLGFGSFVLPAPLLEKFVAVAHLDSIVAAAAPPLGFFARGLIALGAGLIGAVAGILIARKVAGGSAAKPQHPRMAVRNAGKRANRAAADETPRRPLSVHDEVDSGTLDDTETRAMPVKRRTLAMSEEHGQSEFLQHAPLPGAALGGMDTPAVDYDNFDAPVLPEDTQQPVTLELDGAMEEMIEQPRPYADAMPAPDAVASDDTIRFSLSERALQDHLNSTIAPDQEPPGEPARFSVPDLAIEEMVELDEGPAYAGNAAAPFAEPQARQEFLQPAPGFCEPQGHDAFLDDEDAEAEGTFESLTAALKNSAPPAFIAPAFDDDSEVSEEPGLANFSVPEPARPFAAPQAMADTDQVEDHARPAETAAALAPVDTFDAPPSRRFVDHGVAERPLSQLGTAQLVERLAAAMQQRGTVPMAHTPETSAYEDTSNISGPVPEAVEVVTQEAEPAPPRAFDRPDLSPPAPVIPESLRPIGLDELHHGEDDEETIDLGSFTLPLKSGKQFARPDDLPFQSAAVAEQPMAATAEALPEEAEEADEDDWALTENDSYSSLLDMKTPFSQHAEFVRVDEPEPFSSEVEPVVIFPGQHTSLTGGGQGHSAPSLAGGALQEIDALPPAADLQDASSDRPFAEPAGRKPRAFSKRSAMPVQDGPVQAAAPAAGMAPAQRATLRHADPAETERALRAALATLQKMSGAA